MARDRGRPPRVLVQLLIEEGAAPSPGTSVLADGVAVGRVTSSAPGDGGPAAALAYVKHALAEAGRVFEFEGGGRGVASLPGVEAT